MTFFSTRRFRVAYHKQARHTAPQRISTVMAFSPSLRQCPNALYTMTYSTAAAHSYRKVTRKNLDLRTIGSRGKFLPSVARQNKRRFNWQRVDGRAVGKTADQ